MNEIFVKNFYTFSYIFYFINFNVQNLKMMILIVDLIYCLHGKLWIFEEFLCHIEYLSNYIYIIIK